MATRRPARNYIPAYPYKTALEEYEAAVNQRLDTWVLANGGKEVPFTIGTTTYVYVWNPRRHKHGWLNMDTDMIEYQQPRFRSND
jgi:hypothetical protein